MAVVAARVAMSGPSSRRALEFSGCADRCARFQIGRGEGEFALRRERQAELAGQAFRLEIQFRFSALGFDQCDVFRIVRPQVSAGEIHIPKRRR